MPYVTVPKYIDFERHPFGQASALTSSTLSYSAVSNSNAAANNEFPFFTTTINTIPETYTGYNGKIVEVNLGLTSILKQKDEATNTSMTFRWQGRNAKPASSVWVDLIANTTILPLANGATPYNAQLWQGYFAPTAGFNALPFQIRLMVAANTASNVQAKSCSNSWVVCKYYTD